MNGTPTKGSQNRVKPIGSAFRPSDSSPIKIEQQGCRKSAPKRSPENRKISFVGDLSRNGPQLSVHSPDQNYSNLGGNTRIQTSRLHLQTVFIDNKRQSVLKSTHSFQPGIPLFCVWAVFSFKEGSFPHQTLSPAFMSAKGLIFRY
jgi:hypothetical protein